MIRRIWNVCFAMIHRIWVAYRVEVTKALRLKSTYVGPLLVLLAILCLPRVMPIRRDGEGDYIFVAMATTMSLNLLGLLLLLVFCSTLVSSEMNSGVIRTVLVRPILRRDYLLAKMLLGGTYAVALMGIAAAGGWGIAIAFGDLSGVSYGGEMLYTNREMVMDYLLGGVLTMFPYLATVAYAVMISTMTKRSGAAVGAAIGIWILVDAIKYPLNIAPFLFSTYLEWPWEVFTKESDGLGASWRPEIFYCLVTSVVWMVLFTGTAVFIMRRRNLSL